MKENKFIIIMPVFNGENTIEFAINSVLSQSYQNFELVVMDDNSTDATFEKIRKHHESVNFNFNYCKNHERLGSPLANIVRGIELFSTDKEDIIVVVDGDDFLSDEWVLNYLNEVYQNDNIWMTYGQFEPLSHTYHNYCRPLYNTQTYRRSKIWVTSHLRTMKRKLFDKINKDDLKDKNGEYYKMAGDLAYMYPIVEMAGLKHIKFIDKVLYIYNDLSPLNEMKVDSETQLAIADEIQNKPIYPELETC